MPTTPMIESASPLAFDATAAAQQSFARLNQASEKLVRPLSTIVVRQFELGREYMEGNVSDFGLLVQASTPEAFVDAEMELVRRRSERTLAAVRTVTAEMRQAWIDAFDLSGSAAQTETPKSAPASMASKAEA